VSADPTRNQAFVLRGFSDPPGPGHCTVVSFDRRARSRRALRALGKWWGIALLSVFIPVAHFLLVPSFFLFGIFMSVQNLGTSELAKDARGVCPDCGTEQSLDLAAKWRVPQQVTCRNCHRGLVVALGATP